MMLAEHESTAKRCGSIRSNRQRHSSLGSAVWSFDDGKVAASFPKRKEPSRDDREHVEHHLGFRILDLLSNCDRSGCLGFCYEVKAPEQLETRLTGSRHCELRWYWLRFQLRQPNSIDDQRFSPTSKF